MSSLWGLIELGFVWPLTLILFAALLLYDTLLAIVSTHKRPTRAVSGVAASSERGRA